MLGSTKAPRKKVQVKRKKYAGADAPLKAIRIICAGFQVSVQADEENTCGNANLLVEAVPKQRRAQYTTRSTYILSGCRNDAPMFVWIFNKVQLVRQYIRILRGSASTNKKNVRNCKSMVEAVHNT